MSNVRILQIPQQRPLLTQLHSTLRPRTFQYPELLLGWTEEPQILHLTQLQGEDPHLDIEVVEEDSGEIGLYVMAGLTRTPYPLFAEFGWSLNVLRHFENWLVLCGQKGEEVGPAVLVMLPALRTLWVPPTNGQVVQFSRKK